MGIKVRNYAGKTRFRFQDILTRVPSFYLADPKDLTDEQLKEATAYFMALRQDHEAHHVKRECSQSSASTELIPCASTTLKPSSKI